MGECVILQRKRWTVWRWRLAVDGRGDAEPSKNELLTCYGIRPYRLTSSLEWEVWTSRKQLLKHIGRYNDTLLKADENQYWRLCIAEGACALVYGFWSLQTRSSYWQRIFLLVILRSFPQESHSD
ncbi:hypothetical protein RvY_12579-2 [Ramazzottius varieornatus]|uniref:Uncharacterized protein n=1 Tax=Ramazzottius varieornatus TaxID=947166 RepID=A0A1D1VLZ0_RAMVA|nr:hypothetical protein RvY_12579-2 [Ramazzottius varieornatus]